MYKLLPILLFAVSFSLADQDEEIVSNVSDNDYEDISWENIFMKMTTAYNLDGVIDEEYWIVMGISLPLKFESFDNTRIAAFANLEDNYSDIGLYIELNRYIYKKSISLNINLNLSGSYYTFDETNYSDKSLHISPALGIEFPVWLEWIEGGIDIRYSINDLKNENGQNINQGLVIGSSMILDWSKF